MPAYFEIFNTNLFWQRYMKYKTITYQRVKNLGNYESKRLELTAELDENDELEVAIEILKGKVEIALDSTLFEDDDGDVTSYMLGQTAAESDNKLSENPF